ncbi:UDP-N-acetylmuramoyl-L-alanyl-D-glutamate--2,6-diaminopimelate ligase [Deinococcus metallilatus]|uniref:UDP-N-acetylmuramyl-tripeptide synthetase n=1 Tax=Deinococcus metallilatus TaxID=1211322 RepID=A0AAJ5JXB8_9DEIO|nr:UDP-N-acetylmuramoyl-L-alanyl-D-glutamate--2,6-diaminopimelate ligase [Deinococcus metallilatus]MBB5297334.1 UDP-N-acetylmuramoyl-L-alanyl-D-glutamate--2,6-diaminopimelate ligase [Deinococcus metallilatus]QBY10111.1 UDP-N-acetylmuramoyl-L-alanyl-D-glutamate--2,6-diaminopimelate ligase [Deinococcus metallilatus]RXJ08271.1 UDP-N-acetylmuramoyl-L-alanyl-D-glutamate--2,6-diaminopimelate ligase [Deinococcus metallilatus]TLK21178.1 UDP-N-acetylmuramoyl-L-alanyl-D-glutamate--2,6-diaminopimelate lig
MRLPELAAALNMPASDLPDVEVRGVTHNAAWVEPGFAFVAICGARFDGHTFIPDAAAKGAVAVLGEGLAGDAPSPLPYLTVPNARAALADAAAALAGNPSRSLRVVGVTGTDGKTTTSWLTRHLLRTAGLRTGLLSTVGYELPDGELRHFPAHFTTPEAPQVQATLREMVEAGGEAVVLEASSHALALDRVRGVDWDVAVWTHLSQEHLDFHGTVENYFADKRRLVERAPFAVLNVDDPWTAQLRGLAPQETTYSAENQHADWRATGIEERATGLHFHVTSPLGEFGAHLPMIGRFNVANALAGMAAAAHLGATLPQLVDGLASFRGVPGRMELVPGGEADPRVIVDFAHTPPSLEKALTTLRATTAGRLWVLLGSAGGPRDPGKRAPLGEVATRLADYAVFTEEDHRDTPLEDILREMERGAREGGGENFTSIGDRREAIRFVIREAQPGDTVLLAGKGPEDTLERDTEVIPWNEVEEARAALALRA